MDMKNKTLNRELGGKELKDLNLEKVKVVSFDIFDTALTRTVSSPKHIFSIVEKRIKEIFPEEKIEVFSWHRVNAENLARKNAKISFKRDEVSLDEIYKQLSLSLKLDHELIESIKRIEVEAEIENVVPISSVKELFDRAIRENKRVIFVSDMYLPKTVIERILARCGYDGFQDLFVSCEVMKTKGSGRLWDYVIENLGVAREEILHIGDSAWGDISRAESRGINTVHFPWFSKEQKNRNHFTTNVIPLSRLVQKNRIEDYNDLNTSRYIGKSYLAILYAAYTKWIALQAVRCKIDKIYFLSRDGYVLKNTWSIFADAGLMPNNIDISYLQVSRRVLLLSCITELNELDIDFLMSGSEVGRTVENYLSRIGIDVDGDIEKKVKVYFNSSSDIVCTVESYGKMQELFLDLKDEILKHCAELRENTLQYFSEKGIFDSQNRCAIVDLGWQGNMQLGMAKLFELAGKNIDINGFYIGLWRNALGKVHKAGYMAGMICNGFHSGDDEKKLIQSVPLLEDLHSAPHGSVRDYFVENGNISVSYQENPSEEKIYTDVIKSIQDYAFESLHEIASGESVIGYDEIGVGTFNEVIEELSLLPSMRELELLGEIRHLDGFEHSGNGISLVPLDVPLPTNEDEAFSILKKHHYWVPGVLAYWKNKLAPSERGWLNNVASNYSYLGRDWLDSFYY